jgi:type II secretory pathway pseudopilin PulG
MSTSPSKYAENQFDSATRERMPLMDAILDDTVTRATNATAGNPAFSGVIATLDMMAGAWKGGWISLLVQEAALPGKSLAFDEKMAALTRKPDADTPSLLDSWLNTLEGQVAKGGTVYVSLLPTGREAFTTGSRGEQLNNLDQFAIALQAQTTKPLLVTLGGTVATFATEARALRNVQTDAKGDIELARTTQEGYRKQAAAALYALIGQGMVVWNETPELVDNLFDVNILRDPPQDVPLAPADTAWNPASRTLSTTALPASATRLQAWRLGPGGAPELLLIGEAGETALVIPAGITFTPGSLYQLWLVAINSRGSSDPGPVQNWTAV